MVLAAVLRSTWLDARSFWLDELYTVHVVEGSFGAMLDLVGRTEGSPPLYDILAWPWARLFGTGEAALRAQTALISTLIVPVAYLAGRRLGGERLGLATALLCAVSPPLVWHAQDARAYALGALLVAVGFLAALHVRDGAARPRAVALWALASAAALWTHYLCAIPVAVEAAWLLWALRGSRTALSRVVAGIAAIGVAALAALPLLLAQLDQAGTFIDEQPFVSRAIRIPAEWVVGYQAPWSRAAVSAAGAVAALVAVYGLVRSTGAERRVLATPAIVFAGATGALVLAALAGLDYVVGRSLLLFWLPGGLLIAGGFLARRTGRAGPAALAALSVLSVAVVVGSAEDPKFGRMDWRGVYAEAGAGGPGGPRALVGPLETVALGIYADGRDVRAGTVRVREVSIVVMPSLARLGGDPVAPRPPSPAPPEGFRLVDRREAETFTLVRYRAPRPVAITIAALQRLSFYGGRARVFELDSLAP